MNQSIKQTKDYSTIPFKLEAFPASTSSTDTTENKFKFLRKISGKKSVESGSLTGLFCNSIHQSINQSINQAFNRTLKHLLTTTTYWLKRQKRFLRAPAGSENQKYPSTLPDCSEYPPESAGLTSCYRPHRPPGKTAWWIDGQAKFSSRKK